MATKRIRYLTERPGASGARRYFWQPLADLAPHGFVLTRLPDSEAAAIAAAQQLNAKLDAWRRDRKPAIAPAAAPVRDVAALIELYLASRDFAALAGKTQYEYRGCLRVLRAHIGQAAVLKVEPPHMAKLYELLYAKAPARANAVMRVARLLFSFARLQGWRKDEGDDIGGRRLARGNPVAGLKLIGAEPSGLVWPREAVAAFVATADQLGRHSIGTAVLINEWLAQREADVLALPVNLLGASGLLVRQRKTRAMVRLPVSIVPALVARIEAERARHRDRKIEPTRLIISEETGQPYKADNFRHQFDRIRTALAAEQARFTVDYIPAGQDPSAPDAFTVATRSLRFMHLRHTAVVRLAETSAEIAEIAAITGHSLETVTTILEHYLVRTGTLAVSAFQKRLAAEGFNG